MTTTVKTKEKRLKTAKEKRMDEEHLAKMIEEHGEEVVDAACDFHRDLWMSEWDLGCVTFKHVSAVVSSVDSIVEAQSRVKREKYVYFDHEEPIKYDATWHKLYELEDK